MGERQSAGKLSDAAEPARPSLLDLETSALKPFPVKHVTPTASAVQVSQLGRRLVHIAGLGCRRDRARGRCRLLSQSDRVVGSAALLPELADLLEYPGELVRIGGCWVAHLSFDVLLQAADSRSRALHPRLVVLLGLGEADHGQRRYHESKYTCRFLQGTPSSQGISLGK